METKPKAWYSIVTAYTATKSSCFFFVFCFLMYFTYWHSLRCFFFFFLNTQKKLFFWLKTEPKVLGTAHTTNLYLITAITNHSGGYCATHTPVQEGQYTKKVEAKLLFFAVSIPGFHWLKSVCCRKRSPLPPATSCYVTVSTNLVPTTTEIASVIYATKLSRWGHSERNTGIMCHHTLGRQRLPWDLAG